MRILIISDIHANMPALEAVLTAAGEVDATYCLGDIVGYGPDPNECVERLKTIPNLSCIMGNHDSAALGLIDIETFNKEARQSSRWTQKTLTTDSRSFLTALPEKITIENTTLAHGSPRNPIWEYVIDMRIALINFSAFETRFCSMGHSHLPLAFIMSPSEKTLTWKLLSHDDEISLDGRAMINPGSVGQPRDHDPRAAYAIFDSEACTWHAYRVAYDLKAIQKRIRAAGLPKHHADRLTEGW